MFSLGMTGVFVTSLGMTQKCLDEPKKEHPALARGRAHFSKKNLEEAQGKNGSSISGRI